ncbi:hypothetical protein [Xanthomonas campestris]|uniref:hypothetical protein n=1 Tax=Xanthomonas campestris TaxID=339 RepID=UPI002B22D641|nr:hypothetical protein [Xanthomonas campestris]MEA9657830.1 hypothetical protein [Xanthomonas campestris pv. raphani]
MFKNALGRIFQQPISTWIVAAACGAAIATLCIDSRLPMRLLRVKEAANWASAIGSFAAALAAIYLGLSAMKRDQKEKMERTKQVAAVFHGAGARGLGHLQNMITVLKRGPSPVGLKALIRLAETERWWHNKVPSSLIHELPQSASLKASHAVHFSEMASEIIRRSDPELRDAKLEKRWKLISRRVKTYSKFLRSACDEVWDVLGRVKRWEQPEFADEYDLPDEEP